MKTAGEFEKVRSKVVKRVLLPSLFCFAGAVGPAMADAPSLELTITSGITVSSFPTVVNIPMTITHTAASCSGGGGGVSGDLRCLHEFDVKVNGSSILPGGSAVQNPFTNQSACDPVMNSNNLTCSSNGATSADVTVPWTINAAGSYTISARIIHQGNQEGEDEETVTVQLIVAEYPAPPAVANAYINSLPSASRKQFISGVRGCVISAIAEAHAKDEKYGPKGGPYDEAQIQVDVQALSPTCGGPTL